MRGLRREVARVRWLVRGGYTVGKGGRLLHREVCRKAHGAFARHWLVHHIDFDRANNVPSNLIALPPQLYRYLHRLWGRTQQRFDRAALLDSLGSYLAAGGDHRKFLRTAPKADCGSADPCEGSPEPTPPRSISSLYR